MANAVRSQATALEIPVTIQGSKIVPGTEQRELFTETTTTTLVFENGAVVKLTAKVAPGQCVFLRNDQSEKEVLCKVVEARQAGEIGYTDLEFTSYDPKFWDAPAAKTAPPAKVLTAQDRLEAAANSPIASPVMEPNTPSAGEIPAQPSDAGHKSEAEKKIDEAVRNLSATPSTEPSAPASASSSAEAPFQVEQPAAPAQTPEAQNKIDPAEWNPLVAPSVESTAPINAEVPASSPESAPTPKSSGTLVASATPIILESPHESLTHLSKHEPTDEELDWNPDKDAEMLAALASMSAGSKANREPAAKETGPEAASAKPQEKNETTSRAEADAQAKSLSTAPAKSSKSRKSTSVSKPVVIGIAAVVVLAAALGLFWYIRGGLFAHVSQPPVAASASSQAKPPAAPSAQQSPATAAQNPGAAAVQNPSATPATAGAAPSGASAAAPGKEAEDSPAVAAAKLAARGELSRADQEVLGIAHRKSSDKNTSGNAPAKIVSQTAPALPDWAEGLEADRVVTLDALIDEKGNLVESKPISGPHLLQQDAQRAVALWVFEPALSDSKPTSSHLRLTVEFK